jgi:colanic acid biosynthesis glycosyl transferase WcaI
MRERLIERGADPQRVSLISNWVDPGVIWPAPRVNSFGREHGLVERTVLMHAGNIGKLQALETVVEAAQALPDMDFVFLGQGSNQRALAGLVASRGVHNVRMIPFQGRGAVRLALGSADFHLVSLLPGLGGFLEPSKLYSVLAAGRPVIAAMDQASEAARLITECDCGIVVDPSDTRALVGGLRALLEVSHAERLAMGARGAELVHADYSRSRASMSYRLLLRRLIAGDGENS